MARKIKKDLRQVANSGEIDKEPFHIKGTHQADHMAYRTIKDMLKDVKLRGVVEGMPVIHPEIEAPILYIDPIDGSRNWDRQVGDPAFAMAFSNVPAHHALDDLKFAYVEGLLSGDIYYTMKAKAYYRSYFSGKTMPLGSVGASISLREAVAYIKPGYSAAEKVLYLGGSLMREVKDIRAFDNSAMELCHLARGGCDLVLEARDLSDYFNLLAWPILRAVDAQLLSLEGKPLRTSVFEPDQIINFLAASHSELAVEALNTFPSS
jgi:fructose-1,6-bisphosphatase/inositol monophosphatase family enzyme